MANQCIVVMFPDEFTISSTPFVASSALISRFA
jgi:hypothetical protein